MAWSTVPAATSSYRSRPGRIGSPAASAEVQPRGRRALLRRSHVAPDPAVHCSSPCGTSRTSRRAGRCRGRRRPRAGRRWTPHRPRSGCRCPAGSRPGRSPRRTRTAPAPWRATGDDRDRDAVRHGLLAVRRAEVGVQRATRRHLRQPLLAACRDRQPPDVAVPDVVGREHRAGRPGQHPGRAAGRQGGDRQARQRDEGQGPGCSHDLSFGSWRHRTGAPGAAPRRRGDSTRA